MRGVPHANCMGSWDLKVESHLQLADLSRFQNVSTDVPHVATKLLDVLFDQHRRE